MATRFDASSNLLDVPRPEPIGFSVNIGNRVSEMSSLIPDGQYFLNNVGVFFRKNRITKAKRIAAALLIDNVRTESSASLIEGVANGNDVLDFAVYNSLGLINHADLNLSFSLGDMVDLVLDRDVIGETGTSEINLVQATLRYNDKGKLLASCKKCGLDFEAKTGLRIHGYSCMGTLDTTQ